MGGVSRVACHGVSLPDAAGVITGAGDVVHLGVFTDVITGGDAGPGCVAGPLLTSGIRCVMTGVGMVARVARSS